MTRSLRRPGRGASDPRPDHALRPIIGNSLALLWGLGVAYVAIRVSGAAPAGLISNRSTDFMEYYSAGRELLGAHPTGLYDPSALGAMQTHLGAGFGGPHTVLPYLYPPYFAAAVAPLTLLPYDIAYLVWLVLNVVLVVTCLVNLEHAAALRGRARLMFRAGALTFLPTLMAIALGQASMVLLALFYVALLRIQQNQPVQAAFCLALASFKPFYVLPCVLLFVLWRHWGAVVSFLIAAAVLWGSSVVALGASGMKAFVRLLADDGRWQGLKGPVVSHGTLIAPATYRREWNHSFSGLIQLALPSAWQGPALAVLGAGLLLALARSAGGDRRAAYSIAVLGGLLLSPHTLAYDLVLLLIPAAVMLCIWEPRVGAAAWVLLSLDLAILVGYKLAFFVPVQLSALVMFCLVGLLLWRSIGPAPDRSAPAG